MAAVRKSQEVVPYDRFGKQWAIRDSCDENSPPPHVAARKWPPLSLNDAPLCAPIRCKTPPRPRTALQPLGHSNVSNGILQSEIRKLEQENAALRKLNKLHTRLIDGFCKLRVNS